VPTVKSQFVDVEGRRVLVRYAGEGAAVLLLHQSPQNSRSLIPWIERLSARYAVFAPDTPGFGFSDPLPLAQPTIPDLAAALNKLLAALGIERALVYGVHTGAVTGLRLALDFPERVTALVCDGYARFTTEERQALLNGYLPPFEPQWDGGHLLWLWARLREQYLFFPWNTPTKAARLAYPAPTIEKLQSDALELLDAGDGYRAGYRAPFLYDDATAASRVRVRTKILYRAQDVIAAHITRLGALPENVIAKQVADAAALIDETDVFFAENASAVSTLNAQVAVANVKSQRRVVCETPFGPMTAHITGMASHDASLPALLVLNDIGTPSKSPIDAVFGAMTIAIDLPGHGGSRPWNAESFTLDAATSAILAVLDTLGVSLFQIRASGGAASIALALVRHPHCGTRCRALAIVDPIVLSPEERAQFILQLPDLQPHATGAHLLAAWNWARMKHLFWSWQAPTAAAARKNDAPAPYRVHQDVLEMVRSGAGFISLWRSALEIDLVSEIQNCPCEVTVECEDELEQVRMAMKLVNAKALVPQVATTAGKRRWA
jgi:pimeloyl-ACP methyl ester carboxylesterase